MDQEVERNVVGGCQFETLIRLLGKFSCASGPFNARFGVSIIVDEPFNARFVVSITVDEQQLNNQLYQMKFCNVGSRGNPLLD